MSTWNHFPSVLSEKVHLFLSLELCSLSSLSFSLSITSLKCSSVHSHCSDPTQVWMHQPSSTVDGLNLVSLGVTWSENLHSLQNQISCGANQCCLISGWYVCVIVFRRTVTGVKACHRNVHAYYLQLRTERRKKYDKARLRLGFKTL